MSAKVPSATKGIRLKTKVLGLCILTIRIMLTECQNLLQSLTGGKLYGRQEETEMRSNLVLTEMENLKDKMTLGCQAQRQNKREMDPKDTIGLFFQLG